MINLPLYQGAQFACCVQSFLRGRPGSVWFPIFEGTSRSLTYPFWSSFECMSRIDRQFLAKPATAMGV